MGYTRARRPSRAAGMRHATIATATEMKPWSDGNGSRIEGGSAVGILRSRHDRHRNLDGPVVYRRPVRPALIEIRIGTKQTPGQSAHYQLSDCLVRSASFRFFIRLRLRPECASTQRFDYDILVATPMFGVNRPGANGRHATAWILLSLPDLWATSLGGAKPGGRPSGMRLWRGLQCALHCPLAARDARAGCSRAIRGSVGASRVPLLSVRVAARPCARRSLSAHLVGAGHPAYRGSLGSRRAPVWPRWIHDLCASARLRLAMQPLLQNHP